MCAFHVQTGSTQTCSSLYGAPTLLAREMLQKMEGGFELTGFCEQHTVT